MINYSNEILIYKRSVKLNTDSTKFSEASDLLIHAPDSRSETT
jgi:hypothetical protein